MRLAIFACVLAGCAVDEFFAVDDFAVPPDFSVPADFAGAPDLTQIDAGPTLGLVTARNGELYADGKRFRFVGANRYDVASHPPGSGRYYCGNAYSDADLERLMRELASTGATVLRFWAFQSFSLGGSDFSTFDRAIAAARKNSLRLIMTLENEWKDCTQPDPDTADGRKGSGWFAGGYYTGALGTYALPYRDYVRAVVARYKDEPVIAMWQLMNEAESPDADALYDFAVDMAGVIKFLDGNHLLSLGTIGTGQAGTAGTSYRKLHTIGGIDVVEAHDYGDEDVAMPGSPSSTANSIYADLRDAAALGKPFIIGEAGIAAPTPMYPYSYSQRAAFFDAKIGAHWTAGTDGFVIWSFYNLKMDNWQGWDFDPQDPLAAVLKKRAAETP